MTETTSPDGGQPAAAPALPEQITLQDALAQALAHNRFLLGQDLQHRAKHRRLEADVGKLKATLADRDKAHAEHIGRHEAEAKRLHGTIRSQGKDHLDQVAALHEEIARLKARIHELEKQVEGQRPAEAATPAIVTDAAVNE